MIIIYGESNSGKSSKALKLLNLKKKNLYFSLDSDDTIKKMEFENLKVIGKYMESKTFCSNSIYLIDITSEIVSQNDKSPLSYVVIDPINYISRNPHDRINRLLERLQILENRINKIRLPQDYLTIIVIINKLVHFSLENDIIKMPDVTVIEVRKNSNKELVLYQKDKELVLYQKDELKN